MAHKHTIVICSSAAFYQQVGEIADDLESNGIIVVIPHTARVMRESGNYDVSAHKTWYEKEADYTRKADLMRWHFDEIASGDSILVVNHEKHGQPNYIGPNVLMEMSLAFYLKKPIYILNDLPESSPFEEEIRGMFPIVLNGSLEKLQSLIKR
ncbi:MAG TPA: hypothetical protein PK096_01550 [Candidatus Saccharibacteria bacterium]|nr:hypothetical protein [Candidatus Saccharibacteria bacterium]HRK94031.1 hypothetical protein [Candidatus Saccharibacteria bacterium]